MLTDCHAHLDDPSMIGFLRSLNNMKISSTIADHPILRIISNSTDIESSERNIEISTKLPDLIIPFVGIHPQAVKQIASSSALLLRRSLENYFDQLKHLLAKAKGLGEIGLDPKYGSIDLQLEIFQRQLEISESYPLVPISIHARDSLDEVSKILPSFDLSGQRLLFHWFAGTESELSSIQSRGYYVSFGPSLIFSKRIQSLAKSADSKLLLAETDSPLKFSQMSDKEPLSPFAVSSVVFKLAQLRNLTYVNMISEIEENVREYLQAQNSLRVNKE